MKTIRLYVCTMLLAVIAVSATGCSNMTGQNPTTGTTAATTTKAPTTSATEKTSEGVIDGLMDDVKKGVDDVKNGAEDVKDDITGTNGTKATTGVKSSTTETTR